MRQRPLRLILRSIASAMRLEGWIGKRADCACGHPSRRHLAVAPQDEDRGVSSLHKNLPRPLSRSYTPPTFRHGKHETSVVFMWRLRVALRNGSRIYGRETNRTQPDQPACRRQAALSASSEDAGRSTGLSEAKPGQDTGLGKMKATVSGFSRGSLFKTPRAGRSEPLKNYRIAV